MARISVARAGGKNMLAFLDMLAYSEGTAGLGDDGYDVLVGSLPGHVKTFQDLSHHPRVYDSKLNSTAAGRYQITWPTCKGLMKQHGFTDFYALTQDAMAIWLIRGAGAYDDILYGRFELAILKCRGIWASLPGAGAGQREVALVQLKLAYTNAGGTVA